MFEQKDTLRHPLARLPSVTENHKCVPRYYANEVIHVTAVPPTAICERNEQHAVLRYSGIVPHEDNRRMFWTPYDIRL